jgi:outer membrane protein assembly factor BamE (lipoprotein component of BamABCDE complex)
MKTTFILTMLFLVSSSFSICQDTTKYTVADFRYGLSKGMSKQEVAEKFGEPWVDSRYGLLS